jgi:hypothetical protein
LVHMMWTKRVHMGGGPAFLHVGGQPPRKRPSRFAAWNNRPANGQVDLPRGTTAPQTAKSICRVENY